MRTLRRPAAVLLLAALACCASGSISRPVRAAVQNAPPPTVILVSFDGWRWDYHAKTPANNLQRLMARGIHAKGLIPAFPSKTFPNHYSMVTGLYPGHHGVVANSIWDSATGRLFSTSNPRELVDPMWWGGEPLWVTAERAGRRTAMMFWPGSEVAIGGVRPSAYQPYDEDRPGSDRVQWILGRLDAPVAERPTFLGLYFEDVDTAGHAWGPDSQAVRDAVIRADAYLGQLVAGLESRGLIDRVNIVVVSDHGMSATSADRVIVLDDYISPDDVTIADIGPGVGLFPKAGREDAVFRSLAKAHPRLKVYKREDTPAQWHYREHPRIPAIIGVPDEGWQVVRRRTIENVRAGRATLDLGEHGYDPLAVEAMRGIFVAAGPAFRNGAEIPAFQSVDVYDILAGALNLTPVVNDGDPTVARAVLRPDAIRVGAPAVR